MQHDQPMNYSKPQPKPDLPATKAFKDRMQAYNRHGSYEPNLELGRAKTRRDFQGWKDTLALTAVLVVGVTGVYLWGLEDHPKAEPVIAAPHRDWLAVNNSNTTQPTDPAQVEIIIATTDGRRWVAAWNQLASETEIQQEIQRLNAQLAEETPDDN